MLVGHQEHIDKILEALEIAQAGLHIGPAPIASFLLLGPTGVGKTQTARMLAQTIHGKADCMITLDCGEFTLEHEVAKLIGAPPGYIGHRESAPRLSQAKLNAVTSPNNPISILLVDEFDKAAPTMEKIFLGILDTGIIHMGENSKVTFKNTLILFTSNEGDYNRRSFGLVNLGSGKDSRSQLRGIRRPEFVNRLTGVLEYQRLTHDELLRVLQLEVEAIQNQVMLSRGVSLVITLKEPEKALQECNTEDYGARELKRYLQKHVTAPLARMFLDGKEVSGRGQIFTVKNTTPTAAGAKKKYMKRVSL